MGVSRYQADDVGTSISWRVTWGLQLSLHTVAWGRLAKESTRDELSVRDPEAVAVKSRV